MLEGYVEDIHCASYDTRIYDVKCRGNYYARDDTRIYDCFRETHLNARRRKIMTKQLECEINVKGTGS